MNTSGTNEVEQALLTAMSKLRQHVGSLRLQALGLVSNRVVIEHTWGAVGITDELAPDWAIGCGDAAQSKRRGRWCSFCPATHHTNQLAPLDSDLVKPRGDSSCHAFLCDQQQILGHLVTQHAPNTTSSRELLLETRRALTAWHARESRTEEVAHVLLTASGRRISWSANAQVLLNARWEEVSEKIRDRIDNPELSPFLVGGYVARWSKMKRGARSALLVSFSRPEPLEFNWSHALSTHQLEITNLVTTGFDNPTIADKLGISRNTIKYHLKQIYERFDIGSRSELAALIEQGARGCVEQR